VRGIGAFRTLFLMLCMCCVWSGGWSCRYLRTGRLDTLLQYDELLQEMQARRVFQVCHHADTSRQLSCQHMQASSFWEAAQTP
jgi:hypothetical protein